MSSKPARGPDVVAWLTVIGLGAILVIGSDFFPLHDGGN